MFAAVAWFILGILFLLLTAGTLCFIIVMYWISSRDSGSKLPETVRMYLEKRGQAKVIEAQAQLEAARRSGFNWEEVSKRLGEEEKKRV